MCLPLCGTASPGLPADYNLLCLPFHGTLQTHVPVLARDCMPRTARRLQTYVPAIVRDGKPRTASALLVKLLLLPLGLERCTRMPMSNCKGWLQKSSTLAPGDSRACLRLHRLCKLAWNSIPPHPPPPQFAKGGPGFKFAGLRDRVWVVQAASYSRVKSLQLLTLNPKH